LFCSSGHRKRTCYRVVCFRKVVILIMLIVLGEQGSRYWPVRAALLCRLSITHGEEMLQKFIVSLALGIFHFAQVPTVSRERWKPLRKTLKVTEVSFYLAVHFLFVFEIIAFFWLRSSIRLRLSCCMSLHCYCSRSLKKQK
jgi:hypothetical protein